jgi:purine-binding chemotaxis protein CheW
MPAASDRQYVTFGVEDEVFAAPVAMVREILDYGEPFKIPQGPPYLLGLTDVRGRGVPLVDLRTRFGLARVAPTPQTRILVLDVPFEGRMLELGLVADRVFEVASFTQEQIGAAPDIGVSWNSDYISGVVRRDDGFVVLVDLARLFGTEDAVALASAAKRARAA